MRFIPTTTEKVESLKKQAKRLQRAGRGKHAELLDRVARGAGYEHWHHVRICLRETEAIQVARGLVPEIEGAIRAALEGRGRVVVTGPETSTRNPFVLISTEDGDAWMLDPEEDAALCLVWRGVRQPFVVRDLPARIEIEWDGTFELNGPFFSVRTAHPEVGSRAIAGYPIERIRDLLEQVRSADKRIESIFGRADTVPLSPDVVSQLIRLGWDGGSLAEAARQGAQYSPSRDALLFPPVTGS